MTPPALSHVATRRAVLPARASTLLAVLMVTLAGCAQHRLDSLEVPSDPIAVGGTENITWSLLVLSWHRPETYRYFAYVDGVRMPLANVRCERANTVTFTCVSPLPPLRSGRHQIQLVTFDTEAGSESQRSPVIVVAVTPEKPAIR